MGYRHTNKSFTKEDFLKADAKLIFKHLMDLSFIKGELNFKLNVEDKIIDFQIFYSEDDISKFVEETDIQYKMMKFPMGYNEEDDYCFILWLIEKHFNFEKNKEDYLELLKEEKTFGVTEFLTLQLKEYMNLDDLSLKEFIDRYDVTQNIVDLCIDGELYKNVEVIWAIIDNMDYIITLDGKIYTSEEVVIFA